MPCLSFHGSLNAFTGHQSFESVHDIAIISLIIHAISFGILAFEVFLFVSMENCRKCVHLKQTFVEQMSSDVSGCEYCSRKINTEKPFSSSIWIQIHQSKHQKEHFHPTIVTENEHMNFRLIIHVEHATTTFIGWKIYSSDVKYTF